MRDRNLPLGTELWLAHRGELPAPAWPRRDRVLTRILAVAVAAFLALAGVAVAQANTVAAGAGGHPAPAAAPAAQGPSFRLAHVGDISPPTNEPRGDDHGVAELLAALAPDGICLNGDVQYEFGAEAMFRASTGFAGSVGRLVYERILCPAMGNHDMKDGGDDGRAPGFSSYFGPVFDGLEANAAAGRFPAMGCESESPACRPEQGYYIVDLDVDRNAAADWYIVVINTNCGRGGTTGDSASPSCAAGGAQASWMRAAMAARHGGATSGRKAGLIVGHHEPYGTCFFADDRATWPLMVEWQRVHGDVGLWGHTHSTGRLGPTDAGTGVVGSAGSRHIASGGGGRSLTKCRVQPARPGTRYRDDTRYGVALLTLTVSYSPAGWTGGNWTHEFHYINNTRADLATAGIWP